MYAVFPTESDWGAIEDTQSRLPETGSANFRFNVELTWMGIKCNHAAFPDSPNFGPNCPDSDSTTSHFTGF